MTEERDQRRAMDFIGYNHLLLHCISEYPTPLEHMNIGDVARLDGLSDHSLSLITGALATLLGAKLVEKHFSFNNWGKDANVSLNPEQLKIYIQNIRDTEKAMRITPRPTEIEKENLKDFWTL